MCLWVVDQKHDSTYDICTLQMLFISVDFDKILDLITLSDKMRSIFEDIYRVNCTSMLL